MRLSLLAALALGCGTADEPDPAGTTPSDSDPSSPSTDTTSPSTEEPEEPAPYIVPDDDGTSVEVDLAAVEAALQSTLTTALTVTAQPVQEAYDAAMTGEDDRCPYYYTTPDGTYWYDNCTSAEGTEFNGYAFAYEVTGAPDPYSPGALQDYWSVFGAATVVDANGKLMELGGNAYVARTYGAGYTLHTSVVQGTFQWDGPETAGTWLDSPIDPDLVLYSYTVDGLPGGLMFVDGGIGGLDGGWAVAFSENQILSSSLGSSCGTEISGAIGVRTPDGVWVDVLFDGDTEAEVDEALCDGCGEAFVRGERIGQICTDATVLLDWEPSW